MLILHLSDIHFRKAEFETAQDPNFHLRNEIVRDVVKQCERLGPPDAIMLSGDVAFAGDPTEFRFATEWLRDLCVSCGGSLKTVFVIPGNHDVVRKSADSNLVQLIHNQIKASSDPWSEISKQLIDPEARRLLYQSLSNYNEFALQFLCDLLPPERTRAVRELTLNDGSILRIWGLNTAFVSSSLDAPGDIFLDTASVQIPRENGVVNLVAAHHHLSWIRQAREVEDHLNDVAAIQMFGHIHTNRIDMNRNYLRLTASAVHPERHEAGWEPGYNFLELEVVESEQKRRLQMNAHVRVWQAAPGGFRAKMDGESSVFSHSVELEPWTRKPSTSNSTSTSIGEADEAGVGHDVSDGSAEVGVDAMDTLRDLGLRFYKLTFSKKAEIAGRLSLLEDEDSRQPDYERYRQVFLRAEQRGKLEELAEAIKAAEQK